MARLDLNMLTYLDALLTQKGVSAAASQLGISQPSVSAALSKLRTQFGDELLARRGGRYELTALGQELAPRVASAVQESARILSARSDFDPATTERQFRIRISDYAIAVVGSKIFSLLEQRAPRASLQLEILGQSRMDSLASVDGVILPRGSLRGVPHRDLFDDQWVCVMNSEFGASIGEVTLDHLRRSRVIGVFDRTNFSTSFLSRLSVLGIDATSRFSVDSYLALPFLVETSQAVALMPRRIAARFAESFSISVHPCAVLGEGFTEAFWWDRANETDPAHRWFRELIAEAAADRETATMSEQRLGASV